MIFYLSGTGNTRWAAQKIAEATGDRLYCITDLLVEEAGGGSRPQFQLKPGERLGFCFPVHGWRPPRVMRQWMATLTLHAEGHYVYALCTAGDTIGETMSILRSDLAARNIHLDAAASLIMPESYVGLPFMDVDKPERERQKISLSAKRLQTIIAAVRDRRPIDLPLHVGRWPRINSRLLGAYFTQKLVNDKRYHVDDARCTHCGLCATVCPVGDIEGGKGKKPRWKHSDLCMACMACYHHCPRHAIQCGRQTKRKGQYYFKATADNNR